MRQPLRSLIIALSLVTIALPSFAGGDREDNIGDRDRKAHSKKEKHVKGGLPRCEAELEACLEQPCAIFPGDGQKGPELSYTDNGDGTFTDNNTLLIWEIKDGNDGVADYTNPHDVDNLYECGYIPLDDGNLGSAFLAALNTPHGFAGYTDWRLPTIKELQSLVDYSVPLYGPTVAASLPGATAAYRYASSTFDAFDDLDIWYVNFNFGNVFIDFACTHYHLRAVRDGW